MKATILNGCIDDNAFGVNLQGWVTTELESAGCAAVSHILKEIEIAPCTGCFGCWIKTPGECVIDDAGRGISANIVQNEILIFITPVTFGGYSSELKKALDRMISVIMPHFKRVNGEIHHKPRYDRYPNLLAFGFLPNSNPDQERTFKTLMERNAINLGSEKKVCHVFLESDSEETVRGKIKDSIREMGAIS
jgi:hypothetical protein